jgi:hypothetical protein
VSTWTWDQYERAWFRKLPDGSSEYISNEEHMTDRLKGVTVTFREDMREDDARPIIEAIRLLRGVLHVEPRVETSADHFARVQIRNEVRTKLFKVLE